MNKKNTASNAVFQKKREGFLRDLFIIKADVIGFIGKVKRV